MAATQATARVLHSAGVSFGILYEAESNDGNDARCAGAEEIFQYVAERNRTAFDSARYEKIVTTDPHTFHVLKNEYEWRGKPPVVLHITELLELLIRSGRLSLVTGRRGQVTYHDPCYLGRYNGVYEPPRYVLLSAGFELAEMSRNRAMAACCGSGGGRVWMTSGNGAEGTAEACVREAAGLMDVHTIAVACPRDLTATDQAIRKTVLEQRLRVNDVSELVEEALQGTVVRPGPAAFVKRSGN